MLYYANVPPYFNSAKNRLEEAIHETLKEYQRFVFPLKMLPVIQSSLIAAIEELNKQHPRCNPITPSWKTEGHRSTFIEGIFKEVKDHQLWLSGTNGYSVVTGGSGYSAMSLHVVREIHEL